MGGINPLWCGALLYCELRYFDPIQKRPGLPADVAALVTSITADSVTVTLVNLNKDERRNVIIQTGAYGENTCISVSSGKKSVPVNAKSFEVGLKAGAGGELVIKRKRYSEQPTFGFPWSN